MMERAVLTRPVGEVEQPHPTVADSIGGESGGEPVTVLT
jgi:hypothetical protein